MMYPPMDYLMFLLPAMLLAGAASLYTRSTFNRYSRVRAQSGMTGAEAAEALLASQGLSQVRVEQVHGFLSDHYDPMSRTLRLSPDVYGSPSLAAIGVACHEAGHALQHSRRYFPLLLRSGLVPLAQIGSHAAYVVFMLGLFMNALPLVKLACLLFSAVVAFSLVTLPVEWDATARAKRLMVSAGIVASGERDMAGRVLNAAFLTYVAGAFTAIMTLLYYLARAGLIGGRRDD